MDIKKQLKIVASTGEIAIGSTQTLKNLKAGKAKMIILSVKCPSHLREEITNIARKSNVPLYVFDGDGLQLGSSIGKLFHVSALTIKKPGDSEILNLVE